MDGFATVDIFRHVLLLDSGGVKHLLLILFLQAGPAMIQAVQGRRQTFGLAEILAPEMDAQLGTEAAELLQRAGVTLRDADQFHRRQPDELRLGQSALFQTNRRSDAGGIPLFFAAIQCRRLGELFLKSAGKRLLGIETVLKRDIQYWPARQPQGHRRLG